MAKNILTHTVSEPMNGAISAKIDINTDEGNLTIGPLAGDGRMLAKGRLEFAEKVGPPTQGLEMKDGRATLTLKGAGGRRSSFRLPWAACNTAIAWNIDLSPEVPCDVAAYTGGGNVKLNLAGMVIRRLLADAGGGNIDVVLPENSKELTVDVKTGGGNVAVEVGRGTTGTNVLSANSGAGNVTIQLPADIAATIHATSGMGKVIVDSRFSKTGDNRYQSPDYDRAANQVEITIGSGAGNVSVNTR